MYYKYVNEILYIVALEVHKYQIQENGMFNRMYSTQSRPNLKVLAALKKAGVKLFVWGQNLLAENIDPKIISPDVAVASDALIVLMSYQNDGYALMNF